MEAVQKNSIRYFKKDVPIGVLQSVCARLLGNTFHDLARDALIAKLHAYVSLIQSFLLNGKSNYLRLNSESIKESVTLQANLVSPNLVENETRRKALPTQMRLVKQKMLFKLAVKQISENFDWKLYVSFVSTNSILTLRILEQWQSNKFWHISTAKYVL